MKNFKYGFVVMLFAISLTACAQEGELRDPQTFQTELADLDDEQLIDVRTPGEFSEGHLDGAINIDFRSTDFRDQINKLDKDRPVYLYCRSGGRSGQAAAIFSEAGFSLVVDMDGGIMAWEAAGLPVKF